MASTAAMPPPSTRPKAVKPPFWLSRLLGFAGSLLLARLKNHWFVALFGSPPNFAIAMVPRAFVLPGSLFTGDFAGIVVGVPPGCPSAAVGALKPPPWTTKSVTLR